MKTITTIICGFLILSFGICCHTYQKEVKKREVRDSTTQKIGKANQVAFALPEKTRFDSILIKDTARDLGVEIIIPKSLKEGLVKANILLQKITDSLKNKYIDTLDAFIKEYGRDSNSIGNSFRIYPESVYESKKLISYCLVVDEYYLPAPHSVESYYTFNYDIEKQTQIRLSDFFEVKRKKDISGLIKLINTNLADDGFIEKLYNIDFSFPDSSTVSFNFGDYELESGYHTSQSLYDKEEILKLVKPEYRSW